MRIAHVYWSHNGNWADRVIALGTWNLMDRFLKPDRIWITSITSLLIGLKCRPERIQGAYPLAFYRRIFKNSMDFLKRADAVVIGGGGITTELLNEPKIVDFLEDLDKPIIVYSAGFNIHKGRSHEFRFKDRSISRMKDLARFFSVRMDGTKDKYRKLLGLKYRESPDPAIWCDLEPLKLAYHRRKYAMMQMTGGEANEPKYKSNKVRPWQVYWHLDLVAQYLWSKRYTIQLASHVTGDNQFFESEYVFPRLLWNHRKHYRDVTKGLSLYKYARMVVGMRGHTQIIPFAFGVPMIALGNRFKNVGFMQRIGQKDYNVEISDPELCLKVTDLIDRTEAEYEERKEHLKAVKKRFWKVAESDWNEIKEILK